jgi:hypothetical protein
MKPILLASIAAFSLAGPAAFAAVTTQAPPAAQSSVMSRNTGPESAMAGDNTPGFTSRAVPADKAEPAPIAPRHFRIDPPNPFQNAWGPGGAG